MKRFLLIIIAATLIYNPLFSQGNNEKIISFDFVDQNIREILFAFSNYARISIIGDDTVSGNASFQYNGFSFEQAFDSFLMANRLFAEKTANVWIVSRIKILYANNSLVLDSFDATPAQ